MLKLNSSCSILSLVLVAGAGLIGCGSGEEESIDQATQLLATDGVEAVNSNDQATDSLTDATFEAVPSADVMMAADAVVAAPEEAIDGKCRTRAKDPNDPTKVIITLNNCKGRFGRHSVSGTVIVQFTPGDANMMHADFTSQGLTIDGKAANHSASAEITFENGARHIVWTGGFDTVSDSGEAIVHTSNLTIHVDTVAKCRTRNGTGQTTIGDRQMSTTFTDLKVCRGDLGVRSCPTGSVSHTRGDKSVSVAFDGTNVAVVTGPKGQTFEKTLMCGG